MYLKLIPTAIMILFNVKNMNKSINSDFVYFSRENHLDCIKTFV